MDNNFFTHENITSIAVQKRKITILRKRLLREEKILNNIEKKIFTAAESYISDQKDEIKDKFKINHTEEKTRERKKFEKHIIKDKSGINEMFTIKTLYNIDLLNTYLDVVVEND